MAASLVASLTASAAFATTSTSSTGSDQSDYLNCTSALVDTVDTCSQVAGGIVTLTTEGSFTGAAASAIKIDLNGGSIVANDAFFQKFSSTTLFSDNTTGGLAGHSFNVLLPSAAGSVVASVTVYDANGVPSSGGTLTITVTGSGVLGLDTSKSFIAVDDSTGTCPSGSKNFTAANDFITSAPAGTTGAQVGCVVLFLVDGNGLPVSLTGTTDQAVVTIAPFGTIGASHVQTLTLSGAAAGTATIGTGTTVFGYYDTPLNGTSVVGTSTITAQVTYRGTTYNLSSVKFGFTGPVAKVVITQTGYSLYQTGSLVVGTVAYFDTAGNDLGCITTGNTAVSDGTVVTGGAVALSGSGDCQLTATIAAVGKGTIAVKNNGVTSNVVTVYGAKDRGTTATASFDKANVAPGGVATLKVVVKDANGNPVPDGSSVQAVASLGALIGSGIGTATTLNGIASFTYAATNTLGPVVATAVTNGLIATAKIQVGAPSANNANKLGLPAAGGTYSTATKVAALGTYVTWKATLGDMAGKAVTVWVAKKNADGTWGAWTALTSRLAAADGTVIFYWRSKTAAWISVRFGSATTAMSNSVQARWK